MKIPIGFEAESLLASTFGADSEWYVFKMNNYQTQSKRKLLFLISGLGVGGAERQTIDLINNLDLDKFDMGLAYLTAKEDLLHRLDIKRLTVIHHIKRNGKFDLNVLGEIGRLVDAGGFETVICVNEYPLLNAFICKLWNRRQFSLITVLHHTIIPPGVWEWMKNKIYQKFLNHCDKVVFVSENQQKYWTHKYNIRPWISGFIQNGIDVDSFANTYSHGEQTRLRNDHGFQASDFVVGICARLDPPKKHEDFINGIRLARRGNSAIKGLIIGDGGQRDKLVALVRRQSLKDVIRFAGYKADVRPYIAACDCVAITSQSVETFSIAALESMSMGKPMIMTDIGGASEQISHGISGYLYPPGDIDKLAEYITEISEGSKCEEMGARAAKRVRENFTINKMVEKYEKLFLECDGRG